MNWSRRLRSVAAVAALVALLVTGVWLNRTGQLTPETLGNAVASLGIWAGPAYIVAFVVGELLYLPGVAFVGAGRLAFGPGWGLLIAYLGATVAVTVPFLLTRTLRSTADRAWQPRWRLLQRLLDRVEHQPIRSLLVLRLFLFLSPPLNYALAFTGIRTRDYVLGSALGIAAPLSVVVCTVGWLA